MEMRLWLLWFQDRESKKITSFTTEATDADTAVGKISGLFFDQDSIIEFQIEDAKIFTADKFDPTITGQVVVHHSPPFLSQNMKLLMTRSFAMDEGDKLLEQRLKDGLGKFNNG